MLIYFFLIIVYAVGVRYIFIIFEIDGSLCWLAIVTNRSRRHPGAGLLVRRSVRWTGLPQWGIPLTVIEPLGSLPAVPGILYVPLSSSDPGVCVWSLFLPIFSTNYVCQQTYTCTNMPYIFVSLILLIPTATTKKRLKRRNACIWHS